MLRFILFILLASFISSCDFYDYRLRICNQSEHDAYAIDYDTSTLDDYPNFRLDGKQCFLPKDSTISVMTNRGGWPNHIKSARNKKLNIFYIAPDTIKKYSKEYIIKKRMYIQVRSYTLEELIKSNWLIIYK